ncbi:MAG: glycosyl transferase [Pseudooceanicola sp.]|nr:glycosyl transferase [Pseudooceanicola sp.]
MSADRDIGVVVIGRNEGKRLVQCIASLVGRADPLVYVDSGSTDGSVEHARAAGVEVVSLDMSQPFTAARARNTGYARVRDLAPEGQYVQFIDGDCALDPGWFDTARAALDGTPELAVVCGRRRERHPEASLWNRMIDAEWDSPVGEAKACGGDALMRRAALDAVQGYREDLIAGEEPEMCFRMRALGWRIRRLDAEMTLHDAAMTRVSQWWQRSRRAGHTYAEGAALHGNSPERYRRRELARTLIWGLALPLAALLGGLLISPWAFALLLLYPLQVVRMAARGTDPARALFTVLGKFPELQGVLGYWAGRLSGKRRRLIEYK